MNKFIIAFVSIWFFETAFAQRPLFSAPLGIQAYTFRRSFPVDPAKTLDTIRMMGFTEIEGIIWVITGVGVVCGEGVGFCFMT